VAVIKMYTLLGHYVETACNDDPATFNTSGFIAVSEPRLRRCRWQVRAPMDRSRSNSGEIAVKIAALIGAIAYELRYTLVANGVASVPRPRSR